MGFGEDNLTSRPLSDGWNFNWVFLIEILTVGILTVFFLFYFNRVFSTLVSYGIRAYTWRTYRAYIDIQALQISLLGGRIFFKSLKYHAHNETIFVHGGFITWKYWLRKVRDAEVHVDEGPGKGVSDSGDSTKSRDSDTEEKGGRQANKKLPCRISIKVSGLEAFLYNRSPAYDYIIENVSRTRQPSQPDSFGLGASEKPELQSPLTTSSDESKPVAFGDSLDVSRSTQNRSSTAVYRKPPLPLFLRLFPVHVDCVKAAAVLGNESTRSILTVKIDGARGVFDAGHAGPLDVYKQIFSFEVDHPVITMKPNVDYREPQLATAARLKEDARLGIPTELPPSRTKSVFHRPRKPWNVLQHLNPRFKKSLDSIATNPTDAGPARNSSVVAPNIPGQDRWQGLARYLDDELTDEHGEWDSVEYARSSTIADVSKVDFMFYWDVPGPVSGLGDDIHASPEDADDVNGTTPPAYGMDLHIYSGNVVYGPWADRHRIDFQSYFFPATYVDAVPAKRLNAGQYRDFSVFKLYLCLEEDVTVRIPFRESSKDWRWKGQAEGMTSKGAKEKDGKGKSRKKSRTKGATAAPNVRPFGWLDVKVEKDTTINFAQDMLPRASGYRNNLIGDVKGTEMSSSVNHGLLWRSGSWALDLDLSYPLGWNACRDWRFGIKSKDLDVFILRDHLFLLTDLILDWSSGPQPDFFTFIPFTYKLDLDFDNFKLNLNTNDANIINDADSFGDNNFIILYGRRLFGDVRIPLDRYRPVKNEIPFSVRGLDFGMDLLMPPKSTLGTFMHHKKIATLAEVTLDGSHTAYQDTSFALTDTLVFDIHGTKFLLIMYGFLVHYFVRIKENYFGDDLHFRTLEEYQQMIAEGGNLKEFIADRASNRGNDLDVILCIRVDQTAAVLPANIYDVSDNVTIDVPYATVDLRINNYYMDLMLDLGPLSLSAGEVTFRDEVPHNATGQTQIFINGVHLLGTRLFGLPPLEPAYVNHWDVQAGDISGELLDDFVCTLTRVAQAFIIGAPDAENTLSVEFPILFHDAVFLQLKTGMMKLWVHIGQDALLTSLNNTSVEFNDLAGAVFSGRVSVIVPELTVACVDCALLSHRRGKADQVLRLPTHAYLRTAVSLNVLQRKANFAQERSLQQEHIRKQDQRTNRAPFLIAQEADLLKMHGSNVEDKVEPPASLVPGLPPPIGFPGASSASLAETQSSASALSGGRSAPSSAASSYFGIRRELRKKSSSASFARSIAASSRSDKSEASVHRPRRTEKRAQRLDPDAAIAIGSSNPGEKASHSHPQSHVSSVALSSALAAPAFPLNTVEIDLSDLPTSVSSNAAETRNDDKVLFFDDRSTDVFDDTFDHTSLIIKVDSNIESFFSPGVVTFAVNALNLITPRKPPDIIDSMQAGIVMKILSLEKRRHETGSSLDLSFRLPASAFRYVNHLEESKDELDLQLAPLTLTLKAVNPPEERIEKTSLAIHIILNHLALALKETTADGRTDVAIQTHMHDVLLWLVQKDSLSVNLSFRSLQLGSSSRKVEYISSLAERTTVLAEQFAASFEAVTAESARRLQYMAYNLTMAGDMVSDPTFMTRLSYAMRASERHMRNHYSWKIASRLRFTYQSLSDDSKRLLAKNLEALALDVPEDAQSQVLSRWDVWRGWDISNMMNQNVALWVIYGVSEESLKARTKVEIPLDLALRSGKVGVIIDPGPKQTDFSINDFALALSVTPASAPTGSMLDTGEEFNAEQFRSARAVVTQLHAQGMRLHINWQISELIESLTEVVFRNEGYRKSLQTRIASMNAQRGKVSGLRSRFQVVIAIEKAILSLETINLRSLNQAKGLKFSLVGREEGAPLPDQAICALLYAKSTTADLLSGKRHLLRLQAHRPSILLGQRTSTSDEGRMEELNVVGGTQAVLIQMKEEILGLLEVADAIIRDEAAYVKRQLELFGSKEEAIQGSKVMGPRKPFPYLSIALEMGSYRLDFALLQSLSYSIAGKLGRILVIPDLAKKLDVKVTLDLEQHKHYLTSLDAGADDPEDIAVLLLPSINGELRLSQAEHDSRPKIDASLTIEVIQIDASALHGLLQTFKRPELSKTFDTFKDDLETVKRSYQQVFANEHVVDPQIPEVLLTERFEYQINLMLAGITVSAAASTLTNHATAQLAFGLGRTSMKACNRSDQQGQVLPLPEIHVHLKRVFADLKVSNQASTRHCGDVLVSANVDCLVRIDERGRAHHDYKARSDGLQINLFAETASAVVDVVNHLQDKLKDLDLSQERRYLQRLQRARRRASYVHVVSPTPRNGDPDAQTEESTVLFSSSVSVQLSNILIRWIVGSSVPALVGYDGEDLVFSIREIDLATKSEDSARLAIIDLQLGMLPPSSSPFSGHNWNTALMPEVVFKVAHRSGPKHRDLWFHAAGKNLEVLLEPKFVLPASMMERSINLAIAKVRTASSSWESTPTSTGGPRKNPFGNKRLGTMIVEANFAGATVHLQDRHISHSKGGRALLSTGRPQERGRYGQFVNDQNTSNASIRSPGLGLRLQYHDEPEQILNLEVRFDASSNTLYPTVVPLIIQISDTVKEVVKSSDEPQSPAPQKAAQSFLEESDFLTADPSQVLGGIQLNVGVKICRQEFSLSCEPVARVAANANFEDIYITMNSVRSAEHNHFFALSLVVQSLQASVQHVYSRDSTFSFDAESIILSLVNSKHLSGTAGLSAMLKVSPMRTQINARQIQDFWLFREIWFPQEIRQQTQAAPKEPEEEAGSDDYLVQRYQQVTRAAAFPWTASVLFEEMSVELDLGQAIGKCSFKIIDLWATSKKSSNWEENLCIGAGSVGIDSSGRMSGLIELDDISIRMFITWPKGEGGSKQTPRVQASAGFQRLRLKAAFDYQAFAISDISSFDFMMYNVRVREGAANDRLVAILRGGRVNVYITATAASQVVGLTHAFERLIQENDLAYNESLKDVEKFLRRKSSILPGTLPAKTSAKRKADSDKLKAPISLHTDVVVSLEALSIGCFPSSFTDSQVFIAEALDAQARFAVALEHNKIHSALGMTLGQLKVALAAVPHGSSAPKSVGEISITEVVNTVVTKTKGGTILGVPKVVAAMQTWQSPEDNRIDYIFKSIFEGKVDVGWNYSRISFIRGMWATHSRTLANRLGKPVPESAVQITTSGPTDPETDEALAAVANENKGEGTMLSPIGEEQEKSEYMTPGDVLDKGKERAQPDSDVPPQSQQKITAVVNVPQSSYEYHALEPPIIETPQLRDMGEATPPLEWIGLHRDRLPNVTHQILIVTLLEVAKEVEDAYCRALGRS